MLIPVLLFLQAQYWHSEAGATIPMSKIYNKFGIFGGRDVNITEVPYTVSIHRKGHFLGEGSLIAKDIVLTTASCRVKRPDKDSFYTVRAGSSFFDQDGELHNVEKFLIHPYYDDVRIDYDVGIIWLSTPVTFSDRIATIEMKSQGEEVGDGEPTTVTGWGLINDLDVPTQLQKVVIPAINSSECFNKLEIPISPQTMCAGVPGGGKGICVGDAGAPLVHDNKLAGMGSWMLGICADKQYPYEGYTKVSAVRSWIDETIKSYTRHN